MFQKLSFSEDIQTIWNESYKLSASELPFLSYQWHKAYVETIGAKEKSSIFYDPELKTIIPLTQRSNQFLFSGEQEISDIQDSIGPDSKKEVVWREFLTYCEVNNISDLFLTNISEISPTYRIFSSISPGKFTIAVNKRDTSPLIVLPKTYDEYLLTLSRKDRHELRRKIRRFHEDHPNSEIELCEDVPNDLEILISLMKLDDRKKTFFTPSFEAFFKKIPQLFPEQVILQILCIDNHPATAIIAFKSKNIFLLYNSGFDQEHFPGAGFYLKAESIRWAIEHNFEEYNFLRGNERYKYELGGKDSGVYDITIKKK